MNNCPSFCLDEKWEIAISDGLTLPCAICGITPKFDYSVDDSFWKEVCDNNNVSKKMRLGVICLPCLDKLATKIGMDISSHIIDVQFTGIHKTIELLPNRLFYWSKKQ